MCDQHANNQESVTCSSAQSQGSRRRRLWELPIRAHCPVIGVCLPISMLRKLVSKALGGQVVGDDYDVHIGAVVDCSRRSSLSESLQKQLEQRYAPVIQRFAAAKTTEALWQLWVNAVERGDIAGAFWAALTHARCDEALETGLIRDMHMLQHQAGASVRVDLRKMEALQEENRQLAEDLRKTQDRATKQLSAKIAEVEELGLKLAAARMDAIAKDNAIAALNRHLDDLQATIPELASRQRQQQRILEMAARQDEAEAQIHELQRQLALSKKQAEARVAESVANVDRDSNPDETRGLSETVNLQDQTVLCVGGRAGSVRAYQQVVERIGGQFSYHDGGIEDSHSMLDASLGAADMVICQTGCISHNAYWRVKDFCKRHGKRCVFVDNPSASSLARSLDEVFSGMRQPS